MSQRSLPRRIFASVWGAITRIRLALSNLLFLALLVALFFFFRSSAPVPLPERAALLLNMSGTVVDQKSLVDPLQAILSEPSPREHEVLLRDVLDSIRFAAEDPAISALVMELDDLVYVGISKTQEIVDALEVFRESGKPIIAVGDYYSQDQYLLASHADEIIVHPFGGVALEGYSSYRNYFREALEKLSVKVHIFRAGEYKSALAPLERDNMSPAEKEATGRWLGDLWSQYTSMVETQRELEPSAVDDYVNNFPVKLQSENGNAAETALAAGLVDKLMVRSSSNDYLIDVVGAENKEGLYEAIVFERYAARKRLVKLPASDDDRVAVITAMGNIMPGEQPPGTIGGDSLGRMIRNTAEKDGVAAIVLRINSGGGSLFASEIIRQQILYARDLGVPIVVSMGAVAASGGYYIAADADQIWATPTTITGSIGVFAAFPTFHELLDRLGVHTDGVGTTTLAGSLRPDRPLDPALKKAIDSGVAFAYQRFLEVVAQGRGLTVQDVKPVAEGRVWSAEGARTAGLVDKLGSLDDAVEAAANLAGLEDYTVDFVHLPLSARDLLMKQLANRMGHFNWSSGTGAGMVLQGLMAPLREAAGELEALQDPRHLYMRCLACTSVR